MRRRFKSIDIDPNLTQVSVIYLPFAKKLYYSMSTIAYILLGFHISLIRRWLYAYTSSSSSRAHQYESKAIKLYYFMSTISYTPWFSYQINMTLIEFSRIRKDKTVRLAKRLGAAMTACSFRFNIRVSVLS